MTDKAPTLPAEPEIIKDILDGMSLHDNPNLTREDGELAARYIDALLAYATSERERAEKAEGALKNIRMETLEECRGMCQIDGRNGTCIDTAIEQGAQRG